MRTGSSGVGSMSIGEGCCGDGVFASWLRGSGGVRTGIMDGEGEMVVVEVVVVRVGLRMRVLRARDEAMRRQRCAGEFLGKEERVSSGKMDWSWSRVLGTPSKVISPDGVLMEWPLASSTLRGS